MLDEDIRLAAKLAREAGLVHPMDWVRVYESHNEYEWALQWALMITEPWGDDRADLRAAVNTASVMQTNVAEASSEDIDTWVENARHYLKLHHPDE